MKKLPLSLISIAVAMCGCQNYDSGIILQEESEPIFPEQFTGIQHDIMVNILSAHFGGYNKDEAKTRAISQFSLSPYIIDGDTVLYIAQYDNGWDIYSANKATNMLLFSSNEGVFNIDDPNMPDQLNFLIKQNASSIRELSHNDIDYVDSSWGHLALSDETLAKGKIMALNPDNTHVQVAASSLPPGHWVLLKSEEISRETYTSPKLTSTAWGQQHPWNAYSKWVLDSENNLVQAPTGCSSVAVSQYLYFTHFKDGVPQYCPTTATLIPNGKDYIFSIYNSLNWDKMAKTKYSYGTNEAAILIGYVGRSIASEYDVNGTGATDNNCINFLSRTYGTTFINNIFTFNAVKEAIDNGYPLLASARSNKNTDNSTIKKVGHNFLIDQYKETTVKYRYLYGWERDPLPPGTIDKWISDYKDANGNILIYAYTNEVISESNIKCFISMNWGDNGAFNNILYSPTGDWILGEYKFNLNHCIFKRNY